MLMLPMLMASVMLMASEGAASPLIRPPPGFTPDSQGPTACRRQTLEIVVVVIVEYCRADIAVAAGVGESGGVGLIPGLRRG
jgi:hypothetical protein